MKKCITLALLLCVAACSKPKDRAETISVFAASSTTDVMKELAEKYKENGGAEITFNFASSGALARQIDAGAPCDLFISANVKWMDFLDEKSLLANETRADIARNTLVLIAPTDSDMTFEGFPDNLKGKLAVGDFKSVPAGTYAQAALTKLGWLSRVEDQLIKGDNVRTTLLYVERGETDAAIVYRTDAIQSDKVKTLGTFPADSHPPIVYPAARLKQGRGSADDFLTFILSEENRAIWEKYGFSPAVE
ncbi:MAG: molybdate ABC transporter substrate-binding protein [Pontiellaceae bacterium]|nr:molybdate ABC transporter substrate-binding protein [Pontiellaceae bacterium]